METIKHTYQVGYDVSYGFNGDWYYAGTVTRITRTQLTTSSGNKFSLKIVKSLEKVVAQDGWVDYVDCEREVFKSVGGGTWTLTHGIVEETNPHF